MAGLAKNKVLDGVCFIKQNFMHYPNFLPSGRILKPLVGFFILVFIFFFVLQSLIFSVSATSLFAGNFETSFASQGWNKNPPGAKWNEDGNFGYNSNKSAIADGNTGGVEHTLTKMISTAGHTDITFSFVYAACDLESNDYVQAQYTTDGGSSWNTVLTLNDDVDTEIIGKVTENNCQNAVSWTSFSTILPATANNNMNFGVRFVMNFNSNSDLVWIDDANIDGTAPTPTPPESPTPTPEPTPTPTPTPTPEPECHNEFGDCTPPVSNFDNDRNHQIIETEIVPLSLSGSSADNLSGVETAEMKIYQIAGEETVKSENFIEVFAEMTCSPQLEQIPIEIVSLSLVSAEPLTVT